MENYALHIYLKLTSSMIKKQNKTHKSKKVQQDDMSCKASLMYLKITLKSSQDHEHSRWWRIYLSCLTSHTFTDAMQSLSPKAECLRGKICMTSIAMGHECNCYIVLMLGGISATSGGLRPGYLLTGKTWRSLPGPTLQFFVCKRVRQQNSQVLRSLISHSSCIPKNQSLMTTQKL